MPLFDQMYYDQKWSVWDTWKSFGRTVKVYVITSAYRMTNVITAQKRGVNVKTAQKRGVNVITGE